MTWDERYDDEIPALGVVIDAGRGSLPYALIHGESLVTCAAWALGEAGVTPLDLGVTWEGLLAAEEPLVLHDSLCPMTPSDFIASALLEAVDKAAIVVGVRPVTVTVKTTVTTAAGPALGETLDRDRLVAVCSPVVIPAEVLRQIAPLDLDGPLDLTELVASWAVRWPVVQRQAPPEARRVNDLDELQVLAALTAPA